MDSSTPLLQPKLSPGFHRMMRVMTGFALSGFTGLVVFTMKYQFYPHNATLDVLTKAGISVATGVVACVGLAWQE